MKKFISILLVCLLLITAVVYAEPFNNLSTTTNETTATASVGATTKKPVILVGGIGGSKFFEDVWWGVNELWFDEDQILLSYSDNFLDPCGLSSTGNITDTSIRTLRRSYGYTSSDISEGLIDGIETSINIAFSDIFDGLIDELENNGYELGVNLFASPYDWRLDLNQSYQSLDEVIEIAKSRSGWNQVDIVAHSMGGLFTKRYLYQSSTNRSKVDKFITCGTPYLGSPNATWATFVGDNFSVLGGFLGVNPDEVKKLVKNYPANYQLYPSKKYFEKIINANNGAAYTWDGVRYNSYFTEKNYDLDGNYSYNDQLSYEQVDDAVYYWNGSNLYYKNAQYHDALDTVSLHNLGINHYVIAGKNVATLYVMSTNESGALDFEDIRFGDGDGTVPYASAIDTGITATAKYYVNNAEHGGMPSVTGVKNAVVNILNTGSALTSMRSEGLSQESTIDMEYSLAKDTEISGSLNGLMILCKSEEMPVVEKKNNLKAKIGAGESYNKYKELSKKGIELSKEEKKEIELKKDKVYINTIGKGSYVKKYGDIYAIYLPDKDDYKIELKGNKNAKIQIREYTNSVEKILDTVSSEGAIELVTIEYNHKDKTLENK